jgi:hypothetical protein
MHPFSEEREMPGIFSVEKSDAEPHACYARFTDNRPPGSVESAACILRGAGG